MLSNLQAALAAALVPALLLACGGEDPLRGEEEAPPPRFEAVPLQDLPGWEDADLGDVLSVFASTCPHLTSKLSALTAPSDWETACITAEQIAPYTDNNTIKRWLADHFTPLRVEGGKALLTGYFEPVFPASSVPTDTMTAPALTKPDDLISVDLGAFRKKLRGERTAGRVKDGRLVPYADRSAIVSEIPPGSEALAYLQPDDLFFLQIQGSGIVDIDGAKRRLGYAAQNGHTYHAIGKTLVEEGHLTLDEVSMQTIRAWLTGAAAQEAARVRQTNPSYVFFTDRGPLEDDSGPLGTTGVPLTARRSVAVDPLAYPLGAPLWIASDNDDGLSLSGLYIAQDTGGAIKGAGRIDLFTGRGQQAGAVAGELKLEADAYLLLPKEAAARLLQPTS